MVTVSI